MTVEELHNRMSLGEFRRWAMFLSEEPTVGERIDLVGGIIASTLANINRGKTSKVYVPTDFMPIAARQREAAEDALSEEEFAALQLKKFRAAMGG
jgi:hypothetical protein